MIRRLLIANRGEIARRIARTCRDLDISVAAVFSDADAGAPHVREADVAVRLPGTAPADTYLRIDALLAAAARTGADAVHPGYGFLSENADFARAVIGAGLTWVGPPPEAIEAMGAKLEAKDMLAKVGVPVLETYQPYDLVPAELYPVIVKASYGGGGRGMRIVQHPENLRSFAEAASREAGSAFGDGTVFVERYVERPRHIEVQILADRHGRVVAVGERECSIQRRHQKIVEEAPSPAVSEELRATLFEAAVIAARAIRYEGAGTVEFVVTPAGEHYFLEVNTRLQVEHPVTESVTGLDLVRLQLEIAEGAPLPFEVAPPVRGHAIEVRLYAEDPAHDYAPSVGRLTAVDLPGSPGLLREYGVRLDSGYETGSTVSPYYDAMLAKVVSWGPDRAAAARTLAGGLSRARLHGVATNRDQLVRILREPEFLAGGTDTAYLDRHPEVFEPLAADRELAALAYALAGQARHRAEARVQAGIPSGWRNVPSQPQRVAFEGGLTVEYRFDRGRLAEPAGVDLVSATPDEVVLGAGGVVRTYRIGAGVVDGPDGSVVLAELPRFTEPGDQLAAGSLTAPMPGTVLRVAVAAGETVRRGQLLLTLEAMKMEHPVHAPADGLVAALHVAAGAQVDGGAVLAVVDAVVEGD